MKLLQWTDFKHESFYKFSLKRSLPAVVSHFNPPNGQSIDNIAVRLHVLQCQDICTSNPCLIDTVVNDHTSVGKEIPLVCAPANEPVLVYFSEYLTGFDDVRYRTILAAQLLRLLARHKQRFVKELTSPT